MCERFGDMVERYSPAKKQQIVANDFPAEAREAARSVKQLFCEHGDLSLNPWHSHKSWM